MIIGQYSSPRRDGLRRVPFGRDVVVFSAVQIGQSGKARDSVGMIVAVRLSELREHAGEMLFSLRVLLFVFQKCRQVDQDDCDVIMLIAQPPTRPCQRLAQKRLGPGRIFHCMRWLGQAQRAFDLLCDRANTRVAFGKTLGRHQQIQKFIFDSACEIQSARMLTLHAAHKIDQGDEARVEIGLIKVMGATMLHNVIDRAIQVFGAMGVTEDTPLEAMYRRARSARIYDGPDEVHVMSTARRILRSYEIGDGWDFGLR